MLVPYILHDMPQFGQWIKGPGALVNLQIAATSSGCQKHGIEVEAPTIAKMAEKKTVDSYRLIPTLSGTFWDILGG